MFSLNGAVKYKYIPNYQDMRGGYDKLCGVIRSLGEDPEDGTAYVFTSKDQKIVKIIRHEHNECQMYTQCVIKSFKTSLLSPVFDVLRYCKHV